MILCMFVTVVAEDACHRRFPSLYFLPYKMIRSFHHSQPRTLFANSHSGPSGTVKLAKKEAAPKAAATTKEKKPAAKVHLSAQTFAMDTG